MPSSKSSLDKRDVYYRKGKSDGYRARSAYKLLHLDEEFDLFRDVQTAVDLCAAPGSWSQVLGKRLRPGTGPGDKRVVSVDLQPMAPLSGITTLQADITLPKTVPLVLDALGGRKADLVICDGAPDVTGVHDLDAYLHSQLLLAALTLALTLMAPHATLVFKIFLSPLDPTASVLRSQLRTFFPAPASDDSTDELFAEFEDDDATGMVSPANPAPTATRGPGFDAHGRRGGVWVRKPRSSRKGSGEAFIVCRNFDPTTLPLQSDFTPGALDMLRQQVGGTLTLESLASLGTGASVTPDASWQATKAFVGGGDLNATSLRESALRETVPHLSVAFEHRRRDRSHGSVGSGGSISSIDHTPSPLLSAATSMPFVPGQPLSSSPPHYRHSHNDRDIGRIRTTSDMSMSAPQPLPSPLPAGEGGNHVREFQEIVDSPVDVAGFGPSILPPNPGTSSSPPLTAREREILAATPQHDGAVSPALSTSSKTDAFFATSQSESLPTPPKPLANPVSLGRAPSIGRGLPGSAARNRVATTPSPHNEVLATSPTSPTLIAPTPLRSVTGPAPPMVKTTPSPPQQSSPQHLSPRAAERPAGRRRRVESHIAREEHHAEPGGKEVHVGDVLTPVPDDDSLPIESSKDPGTWRLVKPLGWGAFAAVWSAEPAEPAAKAAAEESLVAHPTASSSGGAVCAVKMIDRKSCARNLRSASAFYREVEVLRHLAHQNIVGYVAHFSTSSHHCLVLEQLHGGELFSLIEQDTNRGRLLRPGPDDPEGYGLVRRIFGELCRAASWLHEVEVVHRDIKLENILLTVNPFSLPATSTGSVPLDKLPVPLVKLTDFGLARFIRNDSPLLSTRCGSESYVAPEVVMGNLYDGRKTDAWALGVVLYALIADELPFDDGAPPPPGRARAGSTASTTSGYGGDEREVRRRVMHRIAKGEYGWREGVGSPEVRAVVARLLRRDPARRPKVAQLWDEPWMREEPGRVPPPSEPLRPKAGGTPNGSSYGNPFLVTDLNSVVPPISRRASDTPHRVIQHGVLVDHERIDDVARVETMQ